MAGGQLQLNAVPFTPQGLQPVSTGGGIPVIKITGNKNGIVFRLIIRKATHRDLYRKLSTYRKGETDGSK
jgi:hypothetical protein